MSQQDSCVINREQLSLREKELKAKLFGTALNNNQPLIHMPETYAETNERRKRSKFHEAEKQSSEYLYKPPAQHTSQLGMQAA